MFVLLISLFSSVQGVSSARHDTEFGHAALLAHLIFKNNEACNHSHNDGHENLLPGSGMEKRYHNAIPPRRRSVVMSI